MPAIRDKSSVAARLYEVSEEVFCGRKAHSHGLQSKLAISPQGTWDLQPASSAPETIALKNRPYYLFVHPYGLYHPDLSNVIPSLRSLLSLNHSFLQSNGTSEMLQTCLAVNGGKWALQDRDTLNILRGGIRSLPLEIREMVFNYLLEDLPCGPAEDSPVCDYDALVIRVDVSGLPGYRTLERRCPDIARYTAFLRDRTLADEAERILLSSQEVVIDSRGLAKFLDTRRARWVKRVLITVGLWNGDKSDAGSVARRLEAEALTGPLMALSEKCTQLESVRVEVCLWSPERSDEGIHLDRYASERMLRLSLKFPEAQPKYKALAQPLLHLERTGLLSDLLIRHYSRCHEGFQSIMSGSNGVMSDGERRLCRSFDVASSLPYDPTYEYWGSNGHENCDIEHLRVRYGPGAIGDLPVRDSWFCTTQFPQEYDAWVPIYYYDGFTARHWVQFALREEVDLQTAKDHIDTNLRRSPFTLNYTYDRWVLHGAIRELLALESQPFDYPNRQRGKHGNFVMGPCEPLGLPRPVSPY